METRLQGNVVDVLNGRIFQGRVVLRAGKVAEVHENMSEAGADMPYIMPGLVDAHVHIESSMLVPSEFARLAVTHGTVATVSDPHEIANVVGVPGIDFMIENGKLVPFKFYFGAPSCVPATAFETSGAELRAEAVRELLARPDIRYLSEMMNFPGVLHGDGEVMAKIRAAQAAGKVVDGHAPGLRGPDAVRYAAAGMSTDHECFTLEEALDKLDAGMKVIIREGSAARNFEALWTLLVNYPDRVMLCSDDKHPNDLMRGHINLLVARAIAYGVDPLKVLKAATVNPVFHYGLSVGLLRQGDPADCIVVESLESMRVLATYVEGTLVAENGQTKIQSVTAGGLNQCISDHCIEESLRVKARTGQVRAIQVYDGQIFTGETVAPVRVVDGWAESNPQADLLKIVVLNRYQAAPPAVGFVRSMGLKRGAIGSSVAHDSHNIIAVGIDDRSICTVLNGLIDARGGIAVYDGAHLSVLPLPVAGLMSTEDGYSVGAQYEQIDCAAKELGTPLKAPFMTMSFLALLVIPKLKLSDKGLFDGERFEFVDAFV